MKFSYAWLLDYLDTAPAVEEVAEALTAVGLQVESVEGGVLDVEVTTNRPDAMCHLGLARELAAKLGCGLVQPALPADADAATLKSVRVGIEDRADCPWYTARLLEGVRVAPSPRWLQEKLRAIGLGPINNVVDVTNYVLWETGQPLHAFDADLVSTEITVRRAGRGEKRLTTLDGVARQLDSSVLVIADSTGPVALAGVMGGDTSKVGEGTHRILLESAHFGRAPVRATSRALGMHTDASHRFERGVDPALCAAASARAAAMLVELAGGRMVGLAQAGGPPAALPSGRLEHSRLERFAGFPIPRTEVERILRGLGFGLRGAGDGGWEVTVPSWRIYDVATDGAVEEADLFEEVLRHVGFAATPSTLPALRGGDAGEAPGHAWRERVRDRLAGCGLAEAIHYAFVSPHQDQAFAALVPGPALALTNPLSEAHALMRRSLLPALAESARYNIRRGGDAVGLFELGHLFAPDDEVEAAALVLGGRRDGREADVFDAKGAVESVAALAGVAVELEPADIAGFAAGLAGRLRLAAGGRPIGHLGRLVDPEGDDPYPLLAAEIVFDGWEATPPASPLAIPSRFPSIGMDLTIRHSRATTWRELAASIGAALAGRPELVSFRWFDRYEGPELPAGAVATTVRFLYQSRERSLEQEEVNGWHQTLANDLEHRFGLRHQEET